MVAYTRVLQEAPAVTTVLLRTRCLRLHEMCGHQDVGYDTHERSMACQSVAMERGYRALTRARTRRLPRPVTLTTSSSKRYLPGCPTPQSALDHRARPDSSGKERFQEYRK